MNISINQAKKSKTAFKITSWTCCASDIIYGPEKAFNGPSHSPASVRITHCQLNKGCFQCVAKSLLDSTSTLSNVL